MESNSNVNSSQSGGSSNLTSSFFQIIEHFYDDTQTQNTFDGDHSGLLSDKVWKIFTFVNLVCICTALSCFGICTNVVNIVVFAKQGFQDTINLSLFALAVSDLGALLTMLWQSISSNPSFQRRVNPALLMDEIQNITGGWPHVLFIRITGWMTAYLTIERCMCVLFPLKVKSIITPARSKAVIIAIFVLVSVSFTPIFYSTRLGWKLPSSFSINFNDNNNNGSSQSNRYVFGLVLIENSFQLRRITFLITGTLFSLSYSFLTFAGTCILVVSLTRKSKWRQSVTTSVSASAYSTMVDTISPQQQSSDKRDKKVVRMVIMLAAIFIACLFPPALINIPMMLFPEFSFSGRYKNMVLVLMTFFNVLEGINSSINFFVYYKMSSNFKRVFHQTFLRGKLQPPST